MFSKFQFWFVTVVLALGTAIGYGVLRHQLVLWVGGIALFLWVNGRLREEIEDNFFINAAYTTLTSGVLLVPQLFLYGTVGGWAFLALAAVYQVLSFFTNLDYTSSRARDDIGRNWFSKTKTRGQKTLDHYTITQAHMAGIALTALFYLGGQAVLAALTVEVSRFFIYAFPVYPLLWHGLFHFYMFLTGVRAPRGHRPHNDVDNILLGFWYLIWLVLKIVIAVILSPFHFIYAVYCKIGKLFNRILGADSACMSRVYWVCVIALAVYLVLRILGVTGMIVSFFGQFKQIGFPLLGSYLPMTEFLIGLELEGTFLLDVVLAIPKVLGLIIGFVLDIVLLLLSCLLWLLANLLFFIFYFLLVVTFEALLPLALGVGAVVFIVIYIIQSDRAFADWFRAIMYAILPIGLLVLYFLIANGAIQLF